jgi:hypothetical protein
VLLEYSMVKPDKVAQIPVKEAMQLIVGKLPIRKDAKTLSKTSDASAKQSNGGAGPTEIKAPEHK